MQRDLFVELAKAIACARGVVVEITYGKKGAEDAIYEKSYSRKPDSHLYIGKITGDIEQKTVTDGAELARKLAVARGQVVILGNSLWRMRTRYECHSKFENEVLGFVGTGIQLQCVRQIHAYQKIVRCFDGPLLPLAEGNFQPGDCFVENSQARYTEERVVGCFACSLGRRTLVAQGWPGPGVTAHGFAGTRQTAYRGLGKMVSDGTRHAFKGAARGRRKRIRSADSWCQQTGDVRDVGDSVERLLFARDMTPMDVHELSKQVYGLLEASGKQGVIHGDVCLENICYKDGQYSLIDWGLACGRPFSDLATAVETWPGLRVMDGTCGIPNWEMSADCCFCGLRPSQVEDDLESLLYCCMKILGGRTLPWSDAASSGTEFEVLQLRTVTVASFVWRTLACELETDGWEPGAALAQKDPGRRLLFFSH